MTLQRAWFALGARLFAWPYLVSMREHMCLEAAYPFKGRMRAVNSAVLRYFEDGGQGRNRTADASLFRAALYQLSYLALPRKFDCSKSPEAIGSKQAA